MLKYPDGREIDIDYFVQWRACLWRKPILTALKFLGDFSNKRVLEIGGGSGRMSSLFALMGAHVTMLDDTSAVEQAIAEVKKWNMQDRVKIYHTTGGFDKVVGQKFDIIFTKSVLWSIKDLGGVLNTIDQLLAPGGKVAFVENYRGGKFLLWLRRNLRYGGFNHENIYFGITPQQLHLFEQRFSPVRIRRHSFLVYSIMGNKKDTVRGIIS